MTRLKRGEEITGESEVFVGRMQHVTRRLGEVGQMMRSMLDLKELVV